MNLIILGAPGSGKGTQAALICKKHNVAHISTGDILRKNIADGTELGKQAKAFMDAGKLVPDSLVIAMVRDRLSADDCKAGVLLDGFPRTIAQAQELDKIVSIDAVVYLKTDLDRIAARMADRRVCPKCGYSTSSSAKPDGICPECNAQLIIRDDDKPEIVKDRLETYTKNTAPLIDYYEKVGLLKTIDGMATVENVNAQVEAALQ